MSVPKPTVVLVPGAWHKPAAFQPMTNILELAGYTCIGVELASVGGEKPTDGFEEDIEAIRAVVKSEVDQDHDVLVLFHSYGSVPGGEAVKGLDQTTRRKEGGRGGVIALVYCASFAPPKGKSLLDMLGNQDLPWWDVSSDKKTVNTIEPEKIFYADVSDDLKQSAVTALEPFSYGCFSSKTTWEPWRDIPSTYIYCTDDQAIPIDAQRGMVQGAGGKWSEETLQGVSHSPFLSQPEQTANAVRRAAGETI